MDSPKKMKVIANGVNFSSIIDERFKTNRISVNFVTRLHKDTVTENALIPQILRKGFRGCADFTELNQKLQELYGAYLDADVQKRGDNQILSFSITAIDDRFALHGEQVIAKASEIICDMTLHPLVEAEGFRKRYVELEKNALIDTIEAEINEKRTYAINGLIREMCGDEPYGIPKYGYKDKVAEITPASALSQYEALLKSARIEILFTGCGDADAAFQVFDDAFKSLDRRYAAPSATAKHVPRGGEPRRKTEELSVSQSKLVLGFACDGQDIPDEALRLMSAVFGGTPSSKLFLNVREKLSLCYYCAARYDAYKGLVIVDCGVESQNIEKAEQEILAQLREIQNGHISDKEHESALLSLKNAYSTVYESDTAVENFYLGQILLGKDSTPELEKEKLDRLAEPEIITAAKSLRCDTIYLLTGKGEETDG